MASIAAAEVGTEAIPAIESAAEEGGAAASTAEASTSTEAEGPGEGLSNAETQTPSGEESEKSPGNHAFLQGAAVHGGILGAAGVLGDFVNQTMTTQRELKLQSYQFNFMTHAASNAGIPVAALMGGNAPVSFQFNGGSEGTPLSYKNPGRESNIFHLNHLSNQLFDN